jgi:hypothetical protein
MDADTSVTRRKSERGTVQCIMAHYAKCRSSEWEVSGTRKELCWIRGRLPGRMREGSAFSRYKQAPI